MLRLLSDAALSARFEKLIAEMQAANRIQPPTVASMGKVKALKEKLTEITAEMRRRSGNLTDSVAVSDAVVGGVSDAVDAVASLPRKVFVGLALFGFVLYQFKK